MGNKNPRGTEPGDGQDHEVYQDRAGFGGHLRYTCHSCDDPLEVTCLRQPYMTKAQWDEKLAAWREQHPFRKAKRYRGE